MPYTTEQMTDYWEDIHEIENMMGRRAFRILLRQDRQVWQECWCRKAPEPSLGLSTGYYKGYDALEGYFQAMEKLTAQKAVLVRQKYPKELADKTDHELFGVGSLALNSLTTPVIEVAGDRRTAKGLWYYMDHIVDYTEYGRTARQRWGRLAVDFVREDGRWKLWHVVFADDFDARTGTDWTNPEQSRPMDPDFSSLAQFPFPLPNVPGNPCPPYSETRPITKFPQVPVPYDTFEETFSYGI